MEENSNLKQFYDSQPMIYNNILKEFTKSIHKNVFIINKDILLLNCDLINFNKGSWNMRPEYFSLDHYKHSFVYPVVLLANNLKSIFEFTQSNIRDNYIIAPKLTTITNLLTLI